MGKWSNMRRKMAVLLAVTMVGQPVSVHAEMFEAETESVENEAETVLSDSEAESDATDSGNQTDDEGTVVISQETETEDDAEAEDEINIEDDMSGEDIFSDDSENAEDNVTIDGFSDEEQVTDDADAEIAHSGSCGEYLELTWTLDTDGVLRIDGKGVLSKRLQCDDYYYLNDWKDCKIKSVIIGKDVTAIDRETFEDCKTIESVDLGGVTEIRAKAFDGCTALREIDLSGIKKLGWTAFYNCTGLTEVDLSEITELDTNVFSGCENLTSVNIPKAESIGYCAFEKCYKLESVNMPEVKEIGGSAFLSCEKLTSADIPKVTTIGSSAFKYCSSLLNANFSKVEVINDSAFAGCAKLDNVNLSDVIQIGDSAFSYCNSLTSTDMPKVQTIGAYAFEHCIQLESVDLPETVEIGKGAFQECENLASVNLPKVKTIGQSAFESCSSLNNVTMSEVTQIEQCAFKNTGLTVLNLPDTVESLGEEVCYGCPELKEVHIPEGIKEIKRDSFRETPKLTTLMLPESLEIIGDSAFYNSDLESFTLPAGIKEIKDNALTYNNNTKKIGRQIVFEGDYPENGISDNAFSDNLLLLFMNGGDSWTPHMKKTYGTAGILWRTDSPAIPVSDVAGVYGNYGVLGTDGTIAIYAREGTLYGGQTNKSIGEAKALIKKIKFVDVLFYLVPTFEDCINLESVTIPEGVSNIGAGAFKGCTSLKTVYLPDSLGVIGMDTFSGCTSLETVRFPDGLEEIGERAFKGDAKLTEVHLPASLQSVKKETFSGCRSLRSITFGNNLTSIENYAFEYTAVEELELPEGLQSVGYHAFQGCSKLKKIVFPLTLSQLREESFAGCKPNTVIFRGSYPEYAIDVFTDAKGIRFYYPTSGQWTKLQLYSVAGEKNGHEYIEYDRMIPGKYHYNNDENCSNDGTETAECICGCGLTDTRTVAGTRNPDKHTYTDTYEVLPDGSKNYYCDVCGQPEAEAEESGKCGDSLEWKIYNSNMLSVTGSGAMYDYDVDNPAPWNGKKIKYCKIENGVTSIGTFAFEGCDTLTDLSMGEGIRTIGGYAFYGCSGLAEMKLPDGVYSVGEVAFGGCTGLKKFTAYKNLTHIGNNAFRKCNALTIYGYTGSSIYEYAKEKEIPFESLGYWGTCGDDIEWFLQGDELTISGSAAYMTDYTSEDKAPWSGLTVRHCTFEGAVYSVGSYAFAGMKELESISLSEGMIRIEEHAFDGCAGLTEIQIPETVTDIGASAFSGCTGLEKIELPETVTDIGDSAFTGCTSLPEIELPDKVTEIRDRMFTGCTSLHTVKYSQNLSLIGQEAFKGCTGLNTFTVPEGITEIRKGTFEDCALTEIQLPSTLQSIADSAFAKNKFTEIQIPASVTEIDLNAFSGCEQLLNYVVDDANKNYSASKGILYNKAGTTMLRCPEGKTGALTVPGRVRSIGDYAFKDCSKITELMFLESLTVIGNGAFENMLLEEIELPEGLETLGKDAFSGCCQLTAITVDEDNSNFTSVNGILYNKSENKVIVCPPGLKEIIFAEGITEIGDGAFGGLEKESVIDLPFSMEKISSDNDFGTDTVFRIYDNSLIKWYLTTQGYRCESKGNYAVPWSGSESQHKAMAYMKLRNILSTKPDSKYEVINGAISMSLMPEGEEIVYQYTTLYKGQAEVTIELRLCKSGVKDNEYIMNFHTTDVHSLGYTCTLYKSPEIFTAKDAYKFNWTVSNANVSVNKDTANELASQTLYIALVSLSSCLNNCEKMQMKDFGFLSFDGSDTIHTVVSEEGKQPTCTENGIKGKTWCSICGAVEDEGGVITATGHKEEIIPAVPATCTEAGLTEGIRCSVCGEILKPQEKAGEAAGHKMTVVTDKEATCGMAGSQHEECTVCGYKEKSTEIPATGEHQYGPYKVITEATVLSDGTKERSCSVCGNKETEATAKLTPTIKLSVMSVTLKQKQSATVTVSGLAKGDYVDSWKSGNTKVATVNKAGRITAQMQTGWTTLTVTLKSGKKATVKVTVQKAEVKTTRISGLPKKLTLKVKKKKTLKPVLTPKTSTQKITYKTSNKSVATVSSKGVITAKKPGKVKITVQSGSKKSVITVTVKK